MALPIHVKSSNVAAIAWSGGVLQVTFNNGSLYAYSGVPETIWNDFVNASSKGGYLAKNIKGKYAYEQVAGPISQNDNY